MLGVVFVGVVVEVGFVFVVFVGVIFVVVGIF